MAEDFNGGEPIILDISGRINMESEDTDQAPASGIYLNPGKHALYEIYLTIENENDLNGDPDGFSMDSGKRSYEEGILDKFASYKKKEEVNNCRTLPLSFLDSYFKAYDTDDWINTVLRETRDHAPIWPIHAEH